MPHVESGGAPRKPSPTSVAGTCALLAIVAAFGVWAILGASYPFFKVPEEFSFGMGASNEVRLAYFGQQTRVDRLNSAVALGISGTFLGAILGAAAPACCSVMLRIPVGLVWGAAWGAATGFIAVIAYAALMPGTTLPSVTDVGKAQAVVFALLGIGLGLMYGSFSRSAGKIAVATLAGAIAGGTGGLVYPLLAGIALPAESTEGIIPAASPVRLLWMLLPLTTIGFLVPMLTNREAIAGKTRIPGTAT